MNRPRALVTGSSGAIGRAVALKLSACDMDLVLHYHTRRKETDLLADELRDRGATVDLCAFDVSDTAASKQQLEEVLRNGPVQILINNAGIFDDAPLAGMSWEQWRRVLSVCLDGFYNVTRPLLLPMTTSRWGRIISITSVSGIVGNRGQANYAAAKAGIHAASRSLAYEVASRGVTVNCIAPGIIRTPQTETLFSPEKVAKMVPMQRMGAPEEVAELAAFLASRESAYITGQVIGVNGGMA